MKKRTPKVKDPSLQQIDPAFLEDAKGKLYHNCGLRDEAGQLKPECELSRLAAQKKSDEEGGCPWWINSPENNYSFWTWCRKRSYEDGYMDPLMQNEIAQLLGCSSTKVHFILKEAIEKLKQSKHLHILADLHGVQLEGMDVSSSNLAGKLPNDPDFGEQGF